MPPQLFAIRVSTICPTNLPQPGNVEKDIKLTPLLALLSVHCTRLYWMNRWKKSICNTRQATSVYVLQFHVEVFLVSSGVKNKDDAFIKQIQI